MAWSGTTSTRIPSRWIWYLHSLARTVLGSTTNAFLPCICFPCWFSSWKESFCFCFLQKQLFRSLNYLCSFLFSNRLSANEFTEQKFYRLAGLTCLCVLSPSGFCVSTLLFGFVNYCWPHNYEEWKWMPFLSMPIILVRCKLSPWCRIPTWSVHVNC